MLSDLWNEVEAGTRLGGGLAEFDYHLHNDDFVILNCLSARCRDRVSDAKIENL